jgi:ABC-2 type transport system permease protein
VFFLLFTVQFGLSSIVDERRDATLRRLLAAPIPRGSILGGKVLTSLVLGTASMVMLFVASSLLLGARWGAPAGVAILIVAGVLAATGITAVTATFARTAEQIGSFQAIVAVVLGMLGGTFFPVEQAGGLLSFVSRVTPHFWFMRGLAEAQVGAASVLPAVGALLLIAAVTSAVAALRVGRLVQP